MRICSSSNMIFPRSNSYQLQFTSYNEVISKSMRTPVTSLKNAEDVFQKLITEINNDETVQKSNFFNTLNRLYKHNGLKGLFKELKQSPHRDSYTECMLQYARENNVVNLAKKDNEVLDIINYSGSSDDMRIGFLSDKEKGGIEFYTDKKGDLFVEQTYDRNFLNRGFYSDTGSKKIEIESYAGGTPNRTYYNKDGSKPFFKNLFLGGIPTKGMS